MAPIPFYKHMQFSWATRSRFREGSKYKQKKKKKKKNQRTKFWWRVAIRSFLPFHGFLLQMGSAGSRPCILITAKRQGRRPKTDRLTAQQPSSSGNYNCVRFPRRPRSWRGRRGGRGWWQRHLLAAARPPPPLFRLVHLYPLLPALFAAERRVPSAPPKKDEIPLNSDSHSSYHKKRKHKSCWIWNWSSGRILSSVVKPNPDPTDVPCFRYTLDWSPWRMIALPVHEDVGVEPERLIAEGTWLKKMGLIEVIFAARIR